MKIHYLQHVDYEDLGSIESWAIQHGHPVNATRWHRGDTAPDINDFDLLIVMGGPMNIYEEQLYPWLRDEKLFLANAIAAGKYVLGVCLGAQLLADVLGGKVYPNRHKEIGWFPVQSDVNASGPFAKTLPSEFSPFHWHGDTFTLPAGATLLARSQACANQAFSVGERILGLQFHLEVTADNVRIWTEQGSHELVEAPFIQPPEAMLADANRFSQLNHLMQDVLDRFDAAFARRS